MRLAWAHLLTDHYHRSYDPLTLSTNTRVHVSHCEHKPHLQAVKGPKQDFQKLRIEAGSRGFQTSNRGLPPRRPPAQLPPGNPGNYFLGVDRAFPLIYCHVV